MLYGDIVPILKVKNCSDLARVSQNQGLKMLPTRKKKPQSKLGDILR